MNKVQSRKPINPAGCVERNARLPVWADGSLAGEMQGRDFYYSSLTEEEYLKTMKRNGCKCVLMERDQHPEEHVIFIGVKA